MANEWVKLATKRKCSIGIQILMVLLTIIVSILTKIEKKKKIIDNSQFCSGFSFRLASFLFVQISISLAMDSECRSYHSKWSYVGNAFNWSYHLHYLLCPSTSLQFSYLRTLHSKFDSTIYRYLFDVKYFNVNFFD